MVEVTLFQLFSSTANYPPLLIRYVLQTALIKDKNDPFCWVQKRFNGTRQISVLRLTPSTSTSHRKDGSGSSGRHLSALNPALRQIFLGSRKFVASRAFTLLSVKESLRVPLSELYCLRSFTLHF